MFYMVDIIFENTMCTMSFKNMSVLYTIYFIKCSQIIKKNVLCGSGYYFFHHLTTNFKLNVADFHICVMLYLIRSSNLNLLSKVKNDNQP